MKTITEYEPADIKLGKEENGGEEPDAVISFLFAQLMLVKIMPTPDTKNGADAMLWVRSLIADFLNAAQRDGISIAKTEPIPPVFR